MTDRSGRGAGTDDRDRVGLCAACSHARRIESARGATFWRCGRADTDESFNRYPRLPVIACAGFERRSDEH